MRAQQHRPASPLRGETSPPQSPPPSASVKPSISQFLVHEDSGTRSITSLTPSVGSVTEYAGSSADSDGSTAKETDTNPSTVEPQQVETEPSERNATPSEPAPVVKTPSIREPSPEPQREELVERRNSHTETVRSSHMQDLSEGQSPAEPPKPIPEEPYDFSYLEPKPKIKLGPRPVVTADKPRKSGNMGTSLLPAGYLAKKQEQQRPKSFGANLSQSHAMSGLGLFPAPPPIPNLPEYNPRPVSRGSVKSMPSQKTTAMTPEKLRLMKAVEMRKNKMRKSNPQIRTPMSSDQAPEIPKLPENAEAEQIVQTVVQTSPSDLDESKKLDSGIAMEHLSRAETNAQSGPDDSKHGPDRAREAEAKEPAGLLSLPVSDEEHRSQQIQDPVSLDTTVISGAPISSMEQLAGADEFPLPPKGSPRRNGSRRTSRRSRRSSPLATENAQPEPQAESTPIPPIVMTPDAAVAVDQNVDETAMSTSFENLITDVPAIVTTASSRPQTANGSADVPRNRSQSPYGGMEAGSTGTSGTLTPSDEAFKQMSELAQRRRGLVEPLHIDVDTRRNSVAESLSDNDLLEELQSATFHDAKEMLVSKSPGPSGQILPAHLARSISHDSSASQSRSPVRSINIPSGVSHPEVSLDQQVQQSTERAHEQPQQPQQPQSGISSSSASPVDRCSSSASQRRIVSSGITRRIQALNDLSNREPSAVPVHIPTRGMSPDPAPAFLAQERRPSMRSPHSRTGSSYVMRAKTERAGSVPNGSHQPEPSHVWNTSHDATSNRDSISVKARIVRPTTAGSIEASAENANDLHESQIEINHSRGMPTPTSVSQAFLPPMPSPPTNPPSPDLRSLSSLRRKSLGRSKASTPGPVPVNDETAASTPSADEQASSRTSRFFKRMSTFGSNASKRRSIASPIIPGVGSPNPTERSSSRANSVSTTTANVLDRDTPPAVQVGDLNVQFPDTLVSSRALTSPPLKLYTDYQQTALETPLALPRRIRVPPPISANLATTKPITVSTRQEIPPLRLQGSLCPRLGPARAPPQHLPRIHRLPRPRRRHLRRRSRRRRSPAARV